MTVDVNSTLIIKINDKEFMFTREEAEDLYSKLYQALGKYSSYPPLSYPSGVRGPDINQVPGNDWIDPLTGMPGMPYRGTGTGQGVPYINCITEPNVSMNISMLDPPDKDYRFKN